MDWIYKSRFDLITSFDSFIPFSESIVRRELLLSVSLTDVLGSYSFQVPKAEMKCRGGDTPKEFHRNKQVESVH